MAGYKRPRAFHLVDEAAMPRTATGKIQHRLLRDRLAQAQTKAQAEAQARTSAQAQPQTTAESA
jgi:acyl-coenzyme A synthetase/AMP-(fatty) acid ligase